MAANPITFRVKGLEQLQKRFNALPVSLAKDIDNEIADSCQIVVNEAKAAAPVNDGFLRQSIQYIKPIEDGKHIIQVGARYAPFVEFGTKGKVQVPAELTSYAARFKGLRFGDYYDFLNNILDWVKKKRLAQITNSYTGRRFTRKADLLLVAESVAWSIMKNGIKAHPFLFPAWFRERPKFGQRIKNILRNRGLR